MNQVVYGLCMEAARDQMTASYSAVATRIGMDITDDAWWYQIGTLLDEVSRYEHAHGRRLLSVVVVRQDTERPGAGFFAKAGLAVRPTFGAYWERTLSAIPFPLTRKSFRRGVEPRGLLPISRCLCLGGSRSHSIVSCAASSRQSA